ncbi:MAG: hypothetical protein JSS46_11280 [Proteobacteria bacterium]|nr:hypothetical protein [Pseudomonadota bacterium]
MAIAVSAGPAAAHTISIGYANAGAGSVTFWYGTYHDCTESPPTEGSLSLVGVSGTSYPIQTVAFTQSTATKPIGLVDGTTNFYATNAGPLSPTNTLGLTVACWQGVTFTNLSAGTYQFTYIPIANPSAKWAPWNDGVTTNTVTLSQSVVGGAAAIPTLDPAMLLVLAFAVVGLGIASRRLG